MLNDRYSTLLRIESVDEPEDWPAMHTSKRVEQDRLSNVLTNDRFESYRT